MKAREFIYNGIIYLNLHWWVISVGKDTENPLVMDDNHTLLHKSKIALRAVTRWEASVLPR